MHRRHALKVLVATAAATQLPVVDIFAAPPPKNKYEEENGKGVRFGVAVKQKWRVGMTVRAVGGACNGMFATIPVPTNWPEQEVELVNEEVSKQVRAITYRLLDNGVQQMLVSIPSLAAGDTATAMLTFEVFRKPAEPPADVDILKTPEKPHSSLSRYLQASPYIESKDAKIVAAAKEVITANEDKSDWQKVEAIYDWVRENVKYKEGKLKGALAALKDKDGDCEELTSLFIAMCRASKIPARTVWVPQHCYPEFLLEDDEGKGHWIPCQIAGVREFGMYTDPRPVLQKGDNFKVPEKKDAQRYVAEFIKGKAGGGDPQVQFFRDLLPAD
jgi:hypothetical protein